MIISSLNKHLVDYKNIKENEQWIYSAGFNINQNDKNLSRIDEEIFDLKKLIKKIVKYYYLPIKAILKKKQQYT